MPRKDLGLAQDLGGDNPSKVFSPSQKAVKDALDEIEEVISSSLQDIRKSIEDNEEVTAVALNDLEERKSDNDHTHSYNNLTDKPTIPSVSGLENASNKVTSISSSSTDTQYPSAKAVYDMIASLDSNLATILTDINSRLEAVEAIQDGDNEIY